MSGVAGMSRAAGGLLVAGALLLPRAGLAAEPEAADADSRPAVSPSPGPRDPFRPFTLETRPKKTGLPKTPLQAYELSSLTLVAIIWDTANPKAMVEDATGLGYTIGISTPIGRSGGVVKAIEPDRVLVEEEFVDFYGEKKKTEKILKLKPEGEKRP